MTPAHFSRFQNNRRRHWPHITQFLGRLPAPLFKQNLLIQHNLATVLSDTGQFSDILSREHDHPLLYLHFWLLDAAPTLPKTHRLMLEQHLLAAMVHTTTGVYIQQAICDHSSHVDSGFIFLAQRLIQQADWHLSCLFPADAPFWQYHRQFWDEYTAAPLVSYPAPAPRLALAKIPVTAVALYLDWPDKLPRLWQLIDQLNIIHQILYQLASLRRDVFEGRPNYLIDITRQTLNVPADIPLSPERVLGAFVLSDAVQTIRHDCDLALENGAELATALQLPMFRMHFAALAKQLPRIFGLFEVRKQKPAPQSQPEKPPPNFFRPASVPLPTAIDMAERYLLADPTFRESWEVQRRGAFNVPEMTARAFPAGLIVEILARHGHNVSVAVENIFTQLQATGFRYFDYPAMPPDTDDLALLLRLYRYSARPERHRAMLKPVLSRLAQAIEREGRIPVWLPEPDSAESSISLWGKTCVAVEANVLRGLLDFDPVAFEGTIVRAVKSLVTRWGRRGWSALEHYVPSYWLWTGFDLVHQLQQWPGHPGLLPELSNLQTSLGEFFQQARHPAQLTPQTAALLSLAARSPGNPNKDWRDPGWQTILLKSQRYDGSWAGEPLYSTPTRGEQATWYNSRFVTTAICYDSLKGE